MSIGDGLGSLLCPQTAGYGFVFARLAVSHAVPLCTHDFHGVLVSFKLGYGEAGNLASRPDFGRILIGRASNRPSGRPTAGLGVDFEAFRLASGRSPARSFKLGYGEAAEATNHFERVGRSPRAAGVSG